MADWVSHGVTNLPDAIHARLVGLPSGLRDHIERSRVVSQELAIRHNLDARLADVGTAAHDLARALKRSDLLAEAKRLDMDIGFVEGQDPILLHGPLAARWIAAEDDEIPASVLESVTWHTTGKPGMSEIAKVVFLADKLDPQKVKKFPYLQKVAAKSRLSLDLAILEYLNNTIEYLLKSDHLVHPIAIEFRNELLTQVRQ